MAHVRLDDAGGTVTPYPYILVLGQDDNERIMGEKLGEFGVSVHWDTELVAFTQQAERLLAQPIVLRPAGAEADEPSVTP